jgi:stage V sporulation protein D (sporulation-specific penicillin-binding protein)
LQFEKYQSKVLDQLTTESKVTAARGTILDAAGRVLATNRTVYNVSIFPNIIARAENSAAVSERIADGLSELIDGLEKEQVQKHISHKTELQRTVKRGLSAEEANVVLRFVAENALYDMVAVEAAEVRHYPLGNLASHVLGFTGSDSQGLYGLELQYDKELSGIPGAYVTARDSMGNELPHQYEAYRPAIPGYTLETTLDAYVQSILEEELEATMIESAAANRVCGIVMNVKTGAILAMATAPSFDLNEPFTLNSYAASELAAMGLAEGSDAYKKAYNALLLESWSNKAATEIYMPGSTFKALTCSMVLEQGAVQDLNERFFCSGALAVADRLIHCHKVGGHGSLTFREGLQNSCNPVMMTIAARIGTDCFYDYVKRFGLLEKTGIDLPGEGNSIFHAPSAFTPLDLATASFGQNFKVSVLQMITAISSIANGGELVTPYLVERMTDDKGNVVFQHERAVKRRVISEETAGTIAAVLERGVSGDGGAKNAYVAGYRVAAKTGTSEKIGDNREARIGSCIGFAPADDPEIAVVIVVDEPTDGSRYGSVVAAPYVGNVFRATLPYLGVEAVYTEAEEAQRTLTVPALKGLSVAEATSLLGDSGFSFTLQGEGERVIAQVPAAGSTVLHAGARIVLVLGEGNFETALVPDLVGKSAATANRMLVDLGFNVALIGGGIHAGTVTVVRQEPAAGEAVPPGTVVTLYLPYEEKKE